MWMSQEGRKLMEEALLLAEPQLGAYDDWVVDLKVELGRLNGLISTQFTDAAPAEPLPRLSAAELARPSTAPAKSAPKRQALPGI